jgi:pimeloyl-ACP methyl ester carboxylesterase
MTTTPQDGPAGSTGAGADRTAIEVTAPDGRRLCAAEWGDPAGFPVFALHGTPGTRLNRHPDPSRYAEAGARVISYDRAGYGRSDRNPGRSVVDVVGDVAAIADALGIGEFAVTGGSGGGPHCLAVAARLPDRVVRARCVVGVAPYHGIEDLDWFDGMDPLNVKEFGWALAGEDVLVPELTRELEEMAARVADDPSKLLGDDWELDEADRAVMARQDVAAVMREAVQEMAAGGPYGWVDDDLAFTRPWGFDLAEIRVPVEVRYGAKDVLVPAAHGAWLGAHVPGARVVVEDEAGHLADPDQVVALMSWLVRGD